MPSLSQTTLRYDCFLIVFVRYYSICTRKAEGACIQHVQAGNVASHDYPIMHHRSKRTESRPISCRPLWRIV